MHWRSETIFELSQVVDSYDFYYKQIAACDVELQARMSVVPNGRVAAADAVAKQPEGASKRRYKSKNQPSFDLRMELRRIFGVDLTRIDGIDVITAQVILSELGQDLRAFLSEGAFSSWLELVPRNDITGGKVIRQKARKSKNRVAHALRMAAESLSHSDSYLGARYRRLRSRMDGQEAVKAMAHYLACLVHRLLSKGQEYVDRGASYFEARRAERDKATLQRKATELGLKLVSLA